MTQVGRKTGYQLQATPAHLSSCKRMRRSCTVEPITRTPSRTSGDSDAVGSGVKKKVKERKERRRFDARSKRSKERTSQT